MTKTPKRPRDPNQLAKFVIEAATGEDEAIEDSPKQTQASKGGTAHRRGASAIVRA